MLKKLLLLFVFLWVVGNVFGGDIPVRIEINNVIVGNGNVYVAVYSNENDYKNEQAFVSFILEPTNTTLVHNLELPEGEYVVSTFQDKNNDGRLNSTIFGIPLEHVGKTNYNLRGVPENFNRLKMPINNNTTVLIVNMGRVRPLGII